MPNNVCHFSPCIVDTENTSLATAVHRIMWGKLLNCGQTCVAVDYVVVIGDQAKHNEFIDECRKVVTEFYGEDVAKSEDYARIINERHFEWVNYVQVM